MSNIEPIGQPFLTRPITNGQSHLLRILLENIRNHVVESQRGVKSAVSHRIEQHKKDSDITESAAQQGSRSSDSSDES